VAVLAAAEVDLARHAPRLCAQPGMQLRIVPAQGRDFLIVDDHRVLSGPSQEGGRAMMSDCPHTSDLVRTLFQERWSEGISQADHERLTRIAERPLTAQVVALLAEGLKDDATSARLGVSVRTFRRHVAGLPRELGIRSRFQLGVRARHVGLLPSEPDTGTR
jgi:DNA-binding CsgD family transcriptional regulator